MCYFRRGSAVPIKISGRASLLLVMVLSILSITVQAEERSDINRQVNELIEDTDKNTDSHGYSKEIEALKNINNQYDAVKELSTFQKLKPEEDDISIPGSKLQLYYFISFSMPEQSLRKAVEDAERIQAILVLRGMKDDSMRETLKTIKEYIGERTVQFQIDPVLYREFNINLVPALALAESPECQACGKGQMTVQPVFGDVSISYALTEMKRHSPQDLKPLIDMYITKLKDSYYD